MARLYKQGCGKASVRSSQITTEENYVQIFIAEGALYRLGVEYGNSNQPPPVHRGNYNASGSICFSANTKSQPYFWRVGLSLNIDHGVQRRMLFDFNIYIGRKPSEEDYFPWLAPGNSIIIKLYSEDEYGADKKVLNTYEYKSIGGVQTTGPWNLNVTEVESGIGDQWRDFYLTTQLIENVPQENDIYVSDRGSYYCVEILPLANPDK